MLRLVIVPSISRTLFHLAKLKFSPYSMKNVPWNPHATAPTPMILMPLGPHVGGVTPWLFSVTCISLSIMSPGLTAMQPVTGFPSFLKPNSIRARGRVWLPVGLRRAVRRWRLSAAVNAAAVNSLSPLTVGPGYPCANTGIILTQFIED